MFCATCVSPPPPVVELLLPPPPAASGPLAAVGSAGRHARLVWVEACLEGTGDAARLGFDYTRVQEPAQASALRADLPARREGVHPSPLA